jgi:hypothetical protein
VEYLAAQYLPTAQTQLDLVIHHQAAVKAEIMLLARAAAVMAVLAVELMVTKLLRAVQVTLVRILQSKVTAVELLLSFLATVQAAAAVELVPQAELARED